MAEEQQHTPAPQESRGIYGFVLFIMMNLCTLAYFVWMLAPTEWLQSLPYEPPQPYWGLAVPIFLCTCLFLFAFCIYPSLHSLHDGELDEASAFTDPYSLPHDYFDDKRAKARDGSKKKGLQASVEKPSLFGSSKMDPVQLKMMENKSRTWSSKESDFRKIHKLKGSYGFGADALRPVPPVSDMDLDEVCHLLYLSEESCT